MKNYAHLASRVLNTPLLMEPGYAKTFFAALAPRLGITELHDLEGQVMNAEKLRIRAEGFSSERARNRPYQVIDGVAILPVSGSLVHKFGYMQPCSGMTGYDGIIARVQDALSDNDVRGIMLDLDSPGGEVTGCFDCADQLYQLRGSKPIWSLCYDMNCSAAMAIASATDRRLITQTGIAGSVGVIMAHASYEEMLSKDGIKVTLIHSGQFKADGNPYQDLSKEVLARFQEQTDALRQQFAGKVAQYLGMSVEQVLATEAACYRGQAAIDIGFADEMVNGNQALNRFIEFLNTHETSRGYSMTQNTPAPTAQSTPAPAAEQVDIAAAKAEAKQEERTRIGAILGHAEAECRSKLAHHLAFSTDLSADAAADMLKASAKEQATPATAQTNALDAAMGQTEQPNLSADTGSEDKPDLVAEAMAAFRTATGAK